ncbi:hypothetical protein OH818_25380 [Jiella pelagia]|uniref:Uncharacterized protein n=1 Tax=Jiella pelagia TaxID=2986949 RepID=A0ABY7BYI4_9HYPH|nr:hypothetical protein [Jiella pelagia]WAP68576.1 hypothetical protein OH818_25380 [Jiella pelagia]
MDQRRQDGGGKLGEAGADGDDDRSVHHRRQPVMGGEPCAGAFEQTAALPDDPGRDDYDRHPQSDFTQHHISFRLDA